MPFKLNHDRRSHIPWQKHKVINSAAYDAALRQRGSLTVWFTDEAIGEWRAAPRTTPGGQPCYSPLAILTALALRAVFRLALRQTEGLIGSIVGLLGLELRVPDHSTLSWRAATLELPRPRSRRDGEPMHLLVDSTGLRLCGAGEWLQEKHGTKTRRLWRKLHIGLDAETGQIVAASLTAKEVDDGAEVGPLLDQVAGEVSSFTGDGGYDQDRVYAGVAKRHPEAAVVVPPRATAVPGDTADSAPTQRDRHLQHIAEHGRMAWQKAFGYTARARAEAAIGRFKQGIGDGRRRSRFRVRSTWNTGGGCARARMSAGRPRCTSPSTRSTAFWSWDARTTSAPPDPKRGWGYCARSADLCNTLTCAPASGTNIGSDKDSETRQRAAIVAYARRAGLVVVGEHYDAAVSGADPLDARTGFTNLLAHAEVADIRVILVEAASRFARDLMVQEAGHAMLARAGFALVAVDDPDAFTADTPTAVLVRQLLGTVSQFERATLVAKLKTARDRRSATACRRIEGRPGHAQASPDLVRQARCLTRRSPRDGAKRSLRAIAVELEQLGYVTATGRRFGPGQVRLLLAARL